MLTGYVALALPYGYPLISIEAANSCGNSRRRDIDSCLAFQVEILSTSFSRQIEVAIFDMVDSHKRLETGKNREDEKKV